MEADPKNPKSVESSLGVQDLARAKSAVVDTVDELRETLIEISREIHAHPELAFAEHHAAEVLTGAIEKAGLDVERGAYGLETAFATEFGASEGDVVALLAEYDALPDIGHACGHNLIATASVGAGLALAASKIALPGRIRLLGTPAEERGAGKEIMARKGAFDGVGAAMMIHPSGVNLTTMPCICVAEVEVVYTGRAAHASANPHTGVNALDGLILAYQAIAALRQHIRHTDRIHGVITDGGQAPNIVPDRAAGAFYVRGKNVKHLAELKSRVEGCFAAGAAASGASVEMKWGEIDYLDLNTCWPLADAFRKNAEQIGREFFPLEKLPSTTLGSTDMGNISHRVPSIHPMIAAAPPHCSIHNAEFAQWAGSEMGDDAAIDGAKALAMTALDFLSDAALRTESRAAFEAKNAEVPSAD